MELAVNLVDVSYSYPDGHTALMGINLQAAAGEKIALLGPNGAGKSTLLLHLNGLLQGNGQVQICGVTVQQENLKRLRRLVGLVFQSPEDQLFMPTVFDDVAFGPIYQGLPAEDIQHRVHEALNSVGLQGYGSRASHHLSVGEKKRAAMATVLAMRPQVLALDEPSAGLDPRARRSLIELLHGLPQTMFVASHDLALAEELLPRAVIMDGGYIVADGPARDLLSDRALLARHGLM